MMQQLNQQAGQARRRGRRTLIVIAAVAVVLAGLAAVTCGYARLHFFPSAVAGIQTDRVARSASGEVILSEPVVSPAGAIEYGQDTVFQLTVASSGAADEVVVLLGDGPQPAVHLNDIGWPPDEQSFDGVWTGRLDWGAYRRSGRDLAVRFEYRREGRPAAALDCGAISVTESGVRITSFDCQPQGAVTVFDDLMLTAAMGSPDLPGSVVALVGGGVPRQHGRGGGQHGRAKGSASAARGVSGRFQLPAGASARDWRAADRSRAAQSRRGAAGSGHQGVQGRDAAARDADHRPRWTAACWWTGGASFRGSGKGR